MIPQFCACGSVSLVPKIIVDKLCCFCRSQSDWRLPATLGGSSSATWFGGSGYSFDEFGVDVAGTVVNFELDRGLFLEEFQVFQNFREWLLFFQVQAKQRFILQRTQSVTEKKLVEFATDHIFLKTLPRMLEIDSVRQIVLFGTFGSKKQINREKEDGGRIFAPVQRNAELVLVAREKVRVRSPQT